MPRVLATSPSLPAIPPPAARASAGNIVDSCAIRAGLASASAGQAVYTQFPQAQLGDRLSQQGLVPPGHHPLWLQLLVKPFTRVAIQDGAVL